MLTIEEILELNKNRTPDEYTVGLNIQYIWERREDNLLYELPYGAVMANIDNDLSFYYAAPDMAHHIKELQQERDDYKRTLERIKDYSHEAYSVDLSQSALNKYNKGASPSGVARGKDNE